MINEVKIIRITKVTSWVNARVKLNSQVHFGFWIKIRYDSFSDKVAHEVTQSEKNPNPYVLGTSLPYS